MYVPVNFQKKKKKGGETAANKNRCHIKSFSINPLLKFPFKETVCEAHFVKAAKEKAFPRI